MPRSCVRLRPHLPNMGVGQTFDFRFLLRADNHELSLVIFASPTHGRRSIFFARGTCVSDVCSRLIVRCLLAMTLRCSAMPEISHSYTLTQVRMDTNRAPHFSCSYEVRTTESATHSSAVSHMKCGYGMGAHDIRP